jgi:hypothetical protein
MRIASVCALGLTAVLAAAAAAAASPPPVEQGSFQGWVSWPVAPVFQQHPIRGGFMDPRPAGGEPVYHTGVDIAVRDDQPEIDHPPFETHRVYAIQAGTVWLPPDEDQRSCISRLLRIGHYTYSHVDPIGIVEQGDHVLPGQMIGWTCLNHWHMHLTEFRMRNGQQVDLNPLRKGTSLGPYVDTAPPVVHDIRFYTPAPTAWQTMLNALFSIPTGEQLDPMALHGEVDIRAWVGDRQSFTGWFRGRLKLFQSEISPYEVRVALRRHLGRIVWTRIVFKEDELPGAPFDERYASGTAQNLPAYDCLTGQPVVCAGDYWYHLAPSSRALDWDTGEVADGDYDLCVSAWDIKANGARKCVPITVANASEG